MPSMGGTKSSDKTISCRSRSVASVACSELLTPPCPAPPSDADSLRLPSKKDRSLALSSSENKLPSAKTVPEMNEA